MLNLRRPGPRVVPDRRTAIVDRRRSSLDFRYSLGEPDSYVFTADIYAYMENVQPDRHLGWWRFELPPGTGQGTLEMNFEDVGAQSMHATVDGRRLSSIDSWFNPAYAFDPLGDLQLVIRDSSGDIVRNEPALLKFIDRDILRSFYERQYTTEGYTAPEEAPFLHELHKYKLERLDQFFARYIPGGRVVDVGCGRSLFTKLEGRFPFTVCAGDLNFDSVHARAVHFPHQQWASSMRRRFRFGTSSSTRCLLAR